MIAQIVETLRRHGLESLCGRFYADYRAQVVSTADPEKRGRVQVLVPGAGQSEPTSRWVNPSFLGTGVARGLFWPAERGDLAHVSFELGSPDSPGRYTGAFHPENGVPAEFAYGSDGLPHRRGFITRGGHRLVFDDTPGAEKVTLAWHATPAGDPSRTDPSVTADRAKGKTATFTFEPGGVTVTTAGGLALELDDAGGEIRVKHPDGTSLVLRGATVEVRGRDLLKLSAREVRIEAAKVKLGTGAARSVVRGEDLLQYLATHTHGTPSGPSTQPLVPPTPRLLSPTVQVP